MSHPKRMSPREVREMLAPRMTHVYNGVYASAFYKSGTAPPHLHNDIWHSGHHTSVAECLVLIEAECRRRGADGLPRQFRSMSRENEPHTWHATDYVPSPNGLVGVAISQLVNDPRLDIMAGVDGVTPRGA